MAMPTESYLVLAVAVAALAAVLAVSAWRSHVRNKVEAESERLEQLSAINEGYEGAFRELKVREYQRVPLNSKAQFDRYRPERALDAAVAEDPDRYERWLEDSAYNGARWEGYRSQVDGIPGTQFEKGAYVKAERKLFDEATLDKPVTSPKVFVAWSYTSPKGRNSYSGKEEYGPDDIKRAIEAARSRNTRQAQIAAERARMTDRLRYRVMERDGFRCVLCGSAASDGVQLHVDHIHPVSRGGKTEMSNLRTLCDRCNMGKGAHVERGQGGSDGT